MEITTLDYAGFIPAIKGMRNPMNSWNKSDTTLTQIGEKDKELSIRLQKAGTEHCKHLRMIMVWADITAPLYWWKEFDTYRVGVEKVSCSTMHRLMDRTITFDDFEESSEGCMSHMLVQTICYINELIKAYDEETEPLKKCKYWQYAIQILPESYLQKRTCMMSYAALRGIYRQRAGHKLVEWAKFREWVETLPESWMITE